MLNVKVAFQGIEDESLALGMGVGAAQYRRSILASHPAAPGLVSAEIFSLFCLSHEQY